MTTAILLAAGASTRFGADKLSVEIGGKTILAMSAAAIRGSRCDRRIAVVSAMTMSQAQALSALEFDIVVNNAAENGVSSSIRVGVAAAVACAASRMLIALGDMPFVKTELLDRLIQAAATGDAGLSYTQCGARRTPPAVFDQRWFGRLLALEGDVGAREILRTAPAALAVKAQAGALRDIDTPADL